MEVLGGISSFIAIGQGVAAIPKIIKAVRIVAQSRKELQDLIFELEILVARYDHTKESLSLFAPIAGGAQLIVTQEEPYYMKILRTKLDMLLEELQELAKDCQALSEESSPHIKSFRATWTWKRQKVLRLYEQVRMVQGHLDSATRIFMDRTLHNQSKLLSQIHNAIVNNPPIPQETQTENTIDSTDQNTIVEALRPAFQASGFGPDVSKAYLFAEKFQSNPCTCACHRPQAAQKIDVGPIPGKLSVSHSNISHWIFPCRDCECSLPRALVRVDYQFPKWLWNRAVLFKASLSALAGIGASLRLPAVWPSNDPIWAALRSPSVEEVQKFISQKSYTATDVDPQGGSIMEYAMAYDQLSVVLVLLNRFTDILKDTRAAHNAAAQARTSLHDRSSDLSDFEVYTLNRVVELAADDTEVIQPLLLHDTVRNHGDLNYAMKTDTSTLNDLDAAGFTPLHLACLHDNADALEFLLRYKADVHKTDRQGETPLLLAAYRGQVHFVSCLLDAGSNIKQRGLNGDTVLHKACRSRSLGNDSQTVEFLLGRGAEASAVNDYGETVLHLLAIQPAKSPAVRKCFNLMMQFGAWSVVDRGNHFGNTPMLKAIWEVNDGMVQMLLDRGARCDIPSNKGLTVLHAAGRIANLEIINALRGAEIKALDIRAKSIDGLTPIGELRRAIYRHKGAEVGTVKDRNPTQEEISAFESLLREVRDRQIAEETAKLAEIILDIEGENIKGAREHLQAMIKDKLSTGIFDEAATLKDIDYELFQGLADRAVEGLREFVKQSNMRVKISPFEEEPDLNMS